MDKQKLSGFLKENSTKTNQELADEIRKARKLDNKHNNVLVYQEKRSIDMTAEKLSKSIKNFDSSAELTITINNKTWKQD